VKMVQQGSVKQPLTLSIGDGANDVPMIQQAHVGVGISGKEGQQAVMSADFAIAQFRFLERLLLWHGRMNYWRIAIAILYCFYKNMALIGTLFTYNFFMGGTGATLYQSFVGVGFNVYTFVPIICLAVMENHVSWDMVKKHPRLYLPGLRGEHFSVLGMVKWLFNGLGHGIFMFLLCCFCFKNGIVTFGHMPSDLYVFGNTVMICLVSVVTYKVIQFTGTWTRYTWIIYGLSLASPLAWIAIYSNLLGWVGLNFTEIYGSGAATFGSAVPWMVIILVPQTVFLADYAWQYIRTIRRPQPTTIIMERDRGYIPVHQREAEIEMSPMVGKTDAAQLLRSPSRAPGSVC